MLRGNSSVRISHWIPLVNSSVLCPHLRWHLATPLFVGPLSSEIRGLVFIRAKHISLSQRPQHLPHSGVFPLSSEFIGGTGSDSPCFLQFADAHHQWHCINVRRHWHQWWISDGHVSFHWLQQVGLSYWCVQQTENRRNMQSSRNSCAWYHPWRCILWNHLKRL